MPNLIFVKFLSIMKQWWQKQVERRRREKAWREVPEVKPPVTVKDILEKRKEPLRPKPPYNRNIHSQTLREENEKRIQK